MLASMSSDILFSRMSNFYAFVNFVAFNKVIKDHSTHKKLKRVYEFKKLYTEVAVETPTTLAIDSAD